MMSRKVSTTSGNGLITGWPKSGSDGKVVYNVLLDNGNEEYFFETELKFKDMEREWCEEVEGKSVLFCLDEQADEISGLAEKLGYTKWLSGKYLRGYHNCVRFCSDGVYFKTRYSYNNTITIEELCEIVERWEKTENNMEQEKGYKIKLESEKQAEKVQKLAFKLGFERPEIEGSLKLPFLFLNRNKTIRFVGSKDVFENSPYKAVLIADLEKMVILDKSKLDISTILPSHYPNSGNDDLIAFCIRNNVGFNEGNIMKYVLRHGSKNGKEDLLKAQEYLNRLIQSYES